MVECYICKGRLTLRECGKKFCPLYADKRWLNVKALKDEQFEGTSPSIFVGRFGYPKLNVGFLSLPELKENAWIYDAPQAWSNAKFGIRDILALRSALINARFKTEIKERKSKLLGIAQEAGMSSKPVYAEISLSKKPKRLKNTDNVCAPVMQASDIIKASLIENPKVHPLVEKAVSDTDLKAGEALTDLYLKGIDETQLTKLLSIACLGIKRKLVPTRWGITAVDDTLGRALIKEVKDYKDADCSLFYGSYLGNHYFILLFSEPWSFELFEAYLPNTLLNPNPEIRFCHDHELYNGRTGYAEQCAGGYYACRLAVLEGLKKIKRQGSVLVLRLISHEYNMPLGVWVCREAARRAMNEKYIVFQDKEKILKHVKNYCLQLFGIDVSDVLKQSILLKQKSLFDYQTA